MSSGKPPPAAALQTSTRGASAAAPGDYRGWRMWLVRGAVMLVLLTIAFSGGALWTRLASAGAVSDSPPSGSVGTDAATTWTCAMHPQIRLPKPGQCPICFMDLIPVRADSAGATELPELALSERARVLARVETTPVENRALTHEVRMVGKVAPDETRITYVSSYVPGRLDRLFVNYTGILVRQGDHLAEIYSPELLVAQREYLLALKESQRDRREDPAYAPGAALEAARRKLQLWGIPADEIERLEKEKEPSDHMRIDARATGWVIDRQGYPGMYVETGTRLFTLADLRKVWVLFDAYELDIGLLRYGQLVEFETEAYAGRTFSGRISYIDPTLTESTRTVKVRVNVTNEDMQLRPGMFVRGHLHAQIGEGGEVIETSLMGKWISPMHPEIVKDGPGQCDICGMDLVPAESLGFARQDTPAALVLSIPRTAVLSTGRRAVVYVEKERNGEVVYEGRDVKLGPQAGGFYVVLGGLEEGERVVTRGALAIDSALQIQGRPSMMQPLEGGGHEGGGGQGQGSALSREEKHAGKTEGDGAAKNAASAGPARYVAGAAYHQKMRGVIENYLALVTQLAADDLGRSRAALAGMREALDGVRPVGLEGESAQAFEKVIGEIRAALPPAEAEMELLRQKLPVLNTAVEAYLRSFGHDFEKPLVRIRCPMAFDNRGANWLQTDEQVRNPYFGSKMYRCGSKIGQIAPSGR